jgi:chromosome segregation ATPase
MMQTRDLFHLQTDLIDMKVGMAVSRTIDRVVEQISALRSDMTSLKSDMNAQIHELKGEMNSQIHELKGEMNSQIHELKDDMNSQIHGLRHEMRDGFSSLNTRVTAVETRLGIVNESRKEIRSRFIDYCFKAGWLILGAAVSSLGIFFLHLA